MLKTKSPCEIQKALLAEYLTALDQVRAAQREEAEILMAGMGSFVVKPLLQEHKDECSAARSRYIKHRREHYC